MPRMAVSPRLADGTRRLLLRDPDAVVHDEQIEMPVVVVVEPARGNRPWFPRRRGVRQPRTLRSVLKRSVAPIAIKCVSIHSRNKQIGVPVVIVVGGCHARFKSGSTNAGLERHVGERSVAIIAVEAVIKGWVRFFQGRLGSSVDEVDVRPAVVVVVQHPNSADHWLDLMTGGRRSIAQDEGDPSLPRYILESYGRRLRRCVGGDDEERQATSLPRYSKSRFNGWMPKHYSGLASSSRCLLNSIVKSAVGPRTVPRSRLST